MQLKKLIIIPARNEADNIISVIEDIKQNANDCDYIVINDESFDATKAVLEKNNIPHLNAPINLGIGGAVQLGYMYCLEKGYDIAIQFDGDGQHEAAYIETLTLPIETEDADIAIGSRYIDCKGFQSSKLRRLGNHFLNFLIMICCGYKATDCTSGFRAVNKKWIGIYAKDYPSDYPEPEALVYAKIRKAKIIDVPVQMQERQGGQSSIKIGSSIYYMIKVSLAILLCRWRG
jgi:hypothetical protein